MCLTFSWQFQLLSPLPHLVFPEVSHIPTLALEHEERLEHQKVFSAQSPLFSAAVANHPIFWTEMHL